MGVVAKMSPQGQVVRGERGAEMYLGAVYENNDKLRAMSENAIFGNSTPSGSLNVAGNFDIEKFSASWSEEYYVNMVAPGEPAPVTEYLLTFRARKVYQSAPSPSDGGVSFRFAIMVPLSGDIRLLIKNPSATTWLTDLEEIDVYVSHAIGRRSPEEIAALKEDLKTYTEDSRQHAIKYNSKPEGSPELEAYVSSATLTRRRRLWRALGGRGTYTEGAEWLAEKVEGVDGTT